jgi:cell division protein ZapE
VIEALAARHPQVPASELIAQLTPPPAFASVRFETYVPDPDHPSQAAAVAAGRAFAARTRGPVKRRLFRSPPPEERPGLYFDGGFGVGKTHLLASVWHASPGTKVFGTFVEYTNLVGALGFATAAEALTQHDLVCIDEFELDDPGDTVLMSTLMARLADGGARIAATSNTLPDRLGEGRFAADDFLREIQGLSARFDVVRVDGDDYRHRGLPTAPAPLSTQRVVDVAHAQADAGRRVSVDRFDDVVAHLSEVHPSRYGRMVADLDLVALTDVHVLSDQAAALRFVVLVDRLYDREVPVITSGVPADELFTAAMLAGGYRKKYFRAVSRLVALTAAGQGLVGGPQPQ